MRKKKDEITTGYERKMKTKMQNYILEEEFAKD